MIVLPKLSFLPSVPDICPNDASVQSLSCILVPVLDLDI
jgi:hypothetical protein